MLLLAGLVVLCVIAFVVLFLWLNARGRFMFIDCIVRNRGAIVEPWREYRRDANRFFLFQLAITAGGLLLFCARAFLFFLTYRHPPVVPFTPLIVLAVFWVCFAIVASLITRFMVAIMYRQRCGAIEAFRQVWALLIAHLWVFLLFELFLIVLSVAGLMVSCLAGCVTCCLAMLPYLGTVILLPIVMLLLHSRSVSCGSLAIAIMSGLVPPLQSYLLRRSRLSRSFHRQLLYRGASALPRRHFL